MSLIRRHPDYAFGSWTFPAHGVRVSAVAARHAAGESVESLMEDFGLSREQVEAAVEFRRRRSEAAKRGWKTRRENAYYANLDRSVAAAWEKAEAVGR